MARTPILAAGGIVIRDGSEPLFAIVQRRKDSSWVLPKGKLKRKESVLAAAQREVLEETGHAVFVHEFLGAISYFAGGKPKVVQFWRMAAADEASAAVMGGEIKAVRWLPLRSAIKRLSRPLERVFLRSVGEHALALAASPLRNDEIEREPPGDDKDRADLADDAAPGIGNANKRAARWDRAAYQH
jgi:8-oxo-dGTP diphosphatase